MRRVLVIDDHPLYRAALAEMIGRMEGFELAGQLGDLASALSYLGQQTCDLVILDVNLPDASGIDGIKAVRAAQPNLPIAVISGGLDPAMVPGALAAGATGFLPKSYDPDVLVAAIRLVSAGAIYVPHELSAGGAPPAPAQGGGALTGRELEVLRKMVSGATYKEIARDMGVAEITIKLHAQRIAQKLGARNRAQAIAIAVSQGIVSA